MPLALAVAITFVCAAANDELSCRWQEARERCATAPATRTRTIVLGVWLALGIEIIGWIPYLAALEPVLARDTGALAWIIAASLAGSGVGTVRGFVHASKARANLDG